MHAGKGRNLNRKKKRAIGGKRGEMISLPKSLLVGYIPLHLRILQNVGVIVIWRLGGNTYTVLFLMFIFPLVLLDRSRGGEDLLLEIQGSQSALF